MENNSANSSYATMRVNTEHRPSYMSVKAYLADCALNFKELCKTHKKVMLLGKFNQSEIMELYDLLGYKLPEHLRSMTDIQAVNGRFDYTIVFNPEMDGSSAK